jgi:hypothetical protein
MNVKFWRTFACIVASTLVAAPTAIAYSGSNGDDVGNIDPSKVAALRDRGQAGLDQAFAALDELERQIASARASAQKQAPYYEPESLIAKRDKLRTAIDQIGGQRSCTVSRLYWYTDLEKAKAEADRTGRPILSLRMLGKLTDEFSCANSRFFRTSLYSNQEISAYLRNNFVLHWQSVRPVPRVTIDFGDGRKLERTLTGNSAHYVLAGDGTPLDVLPGLYSPRKFLDWVARLSDFHKSYATSPRETRGTMLSSYHLVQRMAVLAQWDEDIMRLADVQRSTLSTRLGVREAQPGRGRGGAPNARQAGAAAVSKSSTEQRILQFANLGGEQLENAMDDDLWKALANLKREEVKLDFASVALMRTEFPTAAQAGRIAMGGKGRMEDPILRVVARFEESIALDTVRNEYLLHRRIHEKFASGEAITGNIDPLNEWVYAELFLTPSSDPWLGLAPQDVYTALENNGQLTAAN